MKLKSTVRFSFPLASAIAALLGSQHTHAVDKFWEGNSSGTWNSNVNWSLTNSVSTPTVAIPTITDDVFFHITGTLGGTGTAMSLAASQAAKSITFRQSQNFSIASNTSSGTGSKTLTIGAGGITKTSTSGSVTINGNVGGGSAGTGILTVTLGSASSQTWTNDSTTTALNVGTGFISGTSTAAVISLGAFAGANANTLTLAGDGNFNFGTATTTNAVITGTTGSLIKNGAGTLTIGGNNALSSAFTGAITLNEGNLTLLTSGASGTSGGGIAVSGSAAATLQINAGVTTADSITFSNTNATSSVKRNIAASGAYTTGTSGSLTSSFAGGRSDTTAQILSGTSSSATESTLTMSFADSSTATNDFIRRSDVFTTSGTGSDLYVLQLTATGQDSTSFLAYNNGTIWDLAVTGNTGTNNASVAQQNFAGTFADFQTAFGTTLSAYQGAYGLDVSTNSLWAVVNYGGSFAAVPEPTSALAGLLLGAGLLRRKRHIAR